MGEGERERGRWVKERGGVRERERVLNWANVCSRT